MSLNLEAFREDYSQDELLESTVDADPIKQFTQWFQHAKDQKVPEPNAMTLATATADGRPSARIVLLKEAVSEGFIFYSNYESQKGTEIEQNPQVALVFNWLELQRQVRIEGTAQRIEASKSTAYFQSRPKGSQIGAWTSPQSRIIPDRDFLERRSEELTEQFKDREVLPKPEFWGGYLVEPKQIEFWQGRTSRLHDRLRYTRTPEGWVIDRLAP